MVGFQNTQTEWINKISHAYISMLKLKFAKTEFDISFVLIPQIAGPLPLEPLDQNDVEWMMEVLANQTKPPESMLRSLSGQKRSTIIYEFTIFRLSGKLSNSKNAA